MSSTVVIYGLNANVLPHKHAPRGNPHAVAFQQFVERVDPRVVSFKVLIDTATDDSACFCYLNYDSEHHALAGRQLFDDAIFQALTHASHDVDASRMFTCMKADAPKRRWAPVFTIWAGNLFDATDDMVRVRFNDFGRMATMATHGMPPFKIMTQQPTGQRFALVNYTRFTDAKAALDACSMSAITFGAANPPVIARPRTNVVFVQRVLGALMGKGALTMGEVWRVRERMGKDCPKDCAALLHASSDVMRVDTVTLAVTRV